MTTLSRREILSLALASPLAALGQGGPRVREGQRNALDLASFVKAPGRVVPAGDAQSIKKVKLVRSWEGSICRARVVNTGRDAVQVKEVVLFDVAHPLPPETMLYGEGFQMLSQTGGTLGQPVDLGDYADARHYRLPQPEDARVVYGLLTLAARGESP